MDCINDQHIQETKELITPSCLIHKLGYSKEIFGTVSLSRIALRHILHGHDDRLIVVIGPCSIHDTKSAMEYAKRLRHERERFKDKLEIVMRMYFQKPRTTIGWKGLINDPYMNNSFYVDEGLRMARQLLLDANSLGIPAATEFLDLISPRYIADLVSWGVIGARTTESQVHRELASSLLCPVGFKNGTDGNFKIAADAIKVAAQEHHFLSITENGKLAVLSTKGNKDCHIVLRGGTAPNYDSASINTVCKYVTSSGLKSRLMIDTSHANSPKNSDSQILVCMEVAKQIAAGDDRIIGVMLESNLVSGRQDLLSGKELVYGQSITDDCIGWDESVSVLEKLATSVEKRRIINERT
jgi:3-deoxy-7-phosphoheptulonate synthase